MILGPDDPRALGRTSKTWTDSSGKEHPIVANSQGEEFKTVAFSGADLSRPGFAEELVQQLDEAFGGSIIDEVMREL